MIIEIDGHLYESTVGSDVQRDGMYLEVLDASGRLLGEVFYSDTNGSMTFIAHRADLPLALVEWMIAHAKQRLPPTALGARPQ